MLVGLYISPSNYGYLSVPSTIVKLEFCAPTERYRQRGPHNLCS